MKVKIGEQFKWIEGRTVETGIAETKLDIKPGDECYFAMMGNEMPVFNFLTGNLTGKTLIMNEAEKAEFEIEGYDSRAIAKMILSRIKWRCGLNEAMEEFEIEDDRVLDEMEELLDEILYWKKETKE